MNYTAVIRTLGKAGEKYQTLLESLDRQTIQLHIPADTRSAFPVISVQSPVSIQCCWQS